MRSEQQLNLMTSSSLLSFLAVVKAPSTPGGFLWSLITCALAMLSFREPLILTGGDDDDLGCSVTGLGSHEIAANWVDVAMLLELSSSLRLRCSWSMRTPLGGCWYW